MININELKKNITSSIEIAMAKGYTLISDDFGDDDAKCACALGCVLVANNRSLNVDYDHILNTSCEVLQVPKEWAIDFYRGFDGVASSTEASKLGNQIRKTYKTKTYHETLGKFAIL